MNKRKIYFFSALILTVCVIILLVTGSSLLNAALKSEKTILPFGTLITWTGMISLPLTIYWGIKELRSPSGKLNRILSVLLKIIIVLGILWVPISYLLAGNLSFSFSEKETFQGGQDAMRWFWRLSYGIGIGAILILFTYWISLIFKKDKTVANNV